ncbi:hypothetical protein BCR42DRAFT_422145 [Absidia repens]|uniref:Uncharacterized protein n=1 Tax=Absidia repens TaxID=90262 RepID=A0A1X2I784_9FUNG|nr:hypothetical protein BCR42DRAFT_422145 [Absidia repens]
MQHTSLPSLHQQLPGVYLPNVFYENNNSTTINTNNKGGGGRILVRDNQAGGKYSDKMGKTKDTYRRADALSPSVYRSLLFPNGSGSPSNRMLRSQSKPAAYPSNKSPVISSNTAQVQTISHDYFTTSINNTNNNSNIILNNDNMIQGDQAQKFQAFSPTGLFDNVK